MPRIFLYTYTCTDLRVVTDQFYLYVSIPPRLALDADVLCEIRIGMNFRLVSHFSCNDKDTHTYYRYL